MVNPADGITPPAATAEKPDKTEDLTTDTKIDRTKRAAKALGMVEKTVMTPAQKAFRVALWIFLAALIGIWAKFLNDCTVDGNFVYTWLYFKDALYYSAINFGSLVANKMIRVYQEDQ